METPRTIMKPVVVHGLARACLPCILMILLFLGQIIRANATESNGGAKERLINLLSLLDAVQELEYEEYTLVYLFDEPIKAGVRIKLWKSDVLGFVRVDMPADDGDHSGETFTTLLNYKEKAVFYEMNNAVAKAPPDETDRLLSAGAPKPLNVSAWSTVALIGVEDYDGKELEVYELRDGPGSTLRWMRIGIDPLSGIIYWRDIVEEEYREETRFINVRMNHGMSMNPFTSDYDKAEKGEIPILSLHEFLMPGIDPLLSK